MLQSFLSYFSLGGQASSSSASSQAISPVFPLNKVITKIQLKIFSYLNVEEYLQLRCSCKEFSKITFESWERSNQKMDLFLRRLYFCSKSKVYEFVHPSFRLSEFDSRPPLDEFLTIFQTNASQYRCLDLVGNHRSNWDLKIRVQCRHFLLKIFRQENSFPNACEIRIEFPHVDSVLEKEKRDKLAEILMEVILRACPNLTNFTLVTFPIAAIKVLLKNCHQLKHLVLYDLFDLDEECIKLFNDHKSLETVSVTSHLYQMPYASCSKIKKLSYLTVTAHDKDTSLDENSLHSIGNCPQLKTLNLRQLGNGDDLLCSVIPKLITLTNLRVDYCANLSGKLFSVLPTLPNLRKLSLFWMRTEITGEHIQSLVKCPRLEELTLRDCTMTYRYRRNRIGNVFLILKKIHLFASLKKLTIDIKDVNALKNLSNCKKLRYLKVKGFSEYLPEEIRSQTATLLKIAKSCPLEELDLVGGLGTLDLNLIEAFRKKHPKIIINLPKRIQFKDA